jgi:hypothetical protein
MSSTPQQGLIIDRREALRRVAAIMGGTALVGGSSLLAACGADRRRAQTGVGAFSAADVAFLDEIADTILPETTTPGAKAAQVGAFMALMVTDSYKPEDQAIFRTGMEQLEAASVQELGGSFMSATPQARLTLLERLDREQKALHDAREEKERLSQLEARDREEKSNRRDAPERDDAKHYFRMMKELTLLGYFTSEIGCTQAQRYMETPGRFDPCVPYTPGETSWAAHA